MSDLPKVVEVRELVTFDDKIVREMNRMLADGWVLLSAQSGFNLNNEGGQDVYFAYSLGRLEREPERKRQQL